MASRSTPAVMSGRFAYSSSLDIMDGTNCVMGVCTHRAIKSSNLVKDSAEYSNCGSASSTPIQTTTLLAPALVTKVARIDVLGARAIDVAAGSVAGGAGAALAADVRAGRVRLGATEVADAASASVARGARRGVTTRALAVAVTALGATSRRGPAVAAKAYTSSRQSMARTSSRENSLEASLVI